MVSTDIKQNVSIGTRLSCIRKHLGLTRQYIQEKYGLSAETLKSWESDKVALTRKGLDRCLEIYRNEKIIISKEWIITGQGLDPRLTAEIAKIPSDAIASPSNERLTDFDLALKEVVFFRGLSAESVVVQISDNDMQPFYNPGDYVGGRYETNKENWNLNLGKDCIVLTNSGGVYIRRLAKNQKNDFILTLHNPHWGGAYEPVISNINILKVAPIIWHRRLIN